ncbi:hypothetical protein D3C85_1797270 [compost metagenome]
MAAGGTVEEAMINSRIRNSKPFTAKCALEKANEVDAADRIPTQLKAYTSHECRGSERYVERYGVMKRPVMLYRHFRLGA